MLWTEHIERRACHKLRALWTDHGGNSVRLYAEMYDVTLDQIAIADGEGHAFLTNLDRDVRRWQRKARAKGIFDRGSLFNRPVQIDLAYRLNRRFRRA